MCAGGAVAASADGRRRRGSVHLAVAEAVDRLPLIGVPSWLRPITGSVMESAAGSQADPEYRVFYTRSVLIAWAWLALLCGLLISRSEEHTSELQSHHDLVCRLLLEKKKKKLIKQINKKKKIKKKKNKKNKK